MSHPCRILPQGLDLDYEREREREKDLERETEKWNIMGKGEESRRLLIRNADECRKAS